jgi:hypothetical protein
MLAAFESELRKMVLKVQGRVLSQLQAQLSITSGKIDATPANLRALRNLNNLFMKEMDKAGFDRLLEAFVKQFGHTLHFLDETIDVLSKDLETPLPSVKWSEKDLDLLTAFQLNTVSSIETAVETAAAAAMTRGMFTVGGLKFGDLVETLTQKFETSIGKATGLADTAVSVFFATAADLQYKKIEEDEPEPLKYRYSGPFDKLNRAFCRHLLDVDKGYTREQIGKMDNGQFPVGSVFLTRGGHRCRHQWGIDTRALPTYRKEPAVAAQAA